jgi:hypothetical protein
MDQKVELLHVGTVSYTDDPIAFCADFTMQLQIAIERARKKGHHVFIQQSPTEFARLCKAIDNLIAMAATNSRS